MDNLDALFTLQSLLSLQGSSAAALLVPNVLGYLVGPKFNPLRKWVAFIIAMALSYLVAILAPNPELTKWLLAFFNGFVVFASAVGINQMGSGPALLASGRGGRQFFQSWF